MSEKQMQVIERTISIINKSKNPEKTIAILNEAIDMLQQGMSVEEIQKQLGLA